MHRLRLFTDSERVQKTSEIAVLKQSNHPLSQEEITNWLRELREHCHIKQSHFAVSAVVEARWGEEYIYAGGVNVENDEHNKLGIHGEQNALIILQSILGGNANFSKVWIMAAPETVKAGSKDPLADNLALSCGHCRQILLSFTNIDSSVYAVSCNGVVSDPYDLKKLLPDAFSERDLNLQKVQESEIKQKEMISLYENNFSIDDTNATQIIFDILSKTLKPHIINEQFITSPIYAAIFKLKNGIFIPGVLVQDIAFMTTDAIFAVLGHAITRFGAKGVEIEEIHLYSNKENTHELSLLTGCELKLLRQFGQPETPVFCYIATQGLVQQSTLASIAKQEYEKDFGCLPVEKEEIKDLQTRRLV